MDKLLKCGDRVYSVRLAGGPAGKPAGGVDALTAVIDGQDIVCGVDQISPVEWIVTRDGVQTRVFMARSRAGETFVQVRGQAFKLSAVEDDHGAGASDPAASGRLMAAMPGRVIKVLVEPGQEVHKDQPVIIMESMKMEITQSAPFDGKVEEVNVQDGQQIDAGAVLVRIEPISRAEIA